MLGSRSSGYAAHNADWERAIALYRQLGDWGSLVVCLNDLGSYEFASGNYAAAQKRFEEFIELNKTAEFQMGVAGTLYARGTLALMRGDLDQARTCLEQCVQLTGDVGDQLDSLWLRTRVGYVAVLQGELGEARAILSQCAREFHLDQGAEAGVAFALEGMAGLFVRLGNYEQAARLLGWADSARKRVHDERPLGEQADVDKVISACLVKIGEEAFSDAYDAGCAMSMEQAVACVCEDANRV